MDGDVRVRFRNDTPDLVILQSVRFGAAEHLGQLSPRRIMEYHRVAPGDYYVEVISGVQGWIVVSQVA
jgi:hypothetical protein